MLLKYVKLKDCAESIISLPSYPVNRLAKAYATYRLSVIANPNCPSHLLLRAALDPTMLPYNLITVMQHPQANAKVLALGASYPSQLSPYVAAWAKLHPNAPEYLTYL